MSRLVSLSVAWLVSFFALLAPFRALAQEDAANFKSMAYELYEQKRYEESATNFERYLKISPEDLQATFDHASLLSQLGRHEAAAKLFASIHQRNPKHEPAYFKLAVEYVYLQRTDEAEKMFAELQKSSNADMVRAAADAARRLKTDLERAAKLEAEQKVYDLASQFKHREVVEAVNQMEQQGELSFGMAMQRLYALASLHQYALALELANPLAEKYPKASDLALLRADLLAQLGRKLEAIGLWRQIERENAGTPAAAEATRRITAIEREEAKQKEEEAKPPPAPAPPVEKSPEARIFELADRQKHHEVVEAIDRLERERGQIPRILVMQRLYALAGLREYSRALELADELAAKHPKASDVVLVRADLLAQLGRGQEAISMWRQIEREHLGTPAAAEARRRIAAAQREEAQPKKEPFTPPPKPAPPAEKTAEERIFELADRREHREVVETIDRLEQERGELPWMLQMQRLYALQSLGETARAIQVAEQMAEMNPRSAELAVLRADLLIRERRWEDAARVLKQLKEDNPNTPVAAEAERRLRVLPPVANLDKWYWGEAYVSGDYLGRYGTVVGSGFIRHGTYIPNARWLQPYATFRFLADTRSGAGLRQTIIADNSVSLFAGVRAQPFATEYLFAYIEGGVNKDLLDRRDDGDWAADFQAGLYGYKSWGPGALLINTPASSADSAASTTPSGQTGAQWDYFRRGDWFVDAGADFSYYERFANWLGYGQAHQGFRLFQFGSNLAVDAYAVENLGWDARGSFFDNYVEIGPGLRWWWTPRRNWAVILRGEWLNGFYFGRNDRGTRAGADTHYDDFRVGLSIGVTW